MFITACGEIVEHIQPSDDPLGYITKGLIVTEDCEVAVVMANGGRHTFKIQKGPFPLAVSHVLETGTCLRGAEVLTVRWPDTVAGG